MGGKIDIKTKKNIREILLQHLYSHLFFGGDKTSRDSEALLTDVFFADMKEMKAEYFKVTYADLISHLPSVEESIARAYKGNFSELNLIDRALTILCVYEMTFLREDKKLVISEGLRLSDKFASPDFDKKLHAFLDGMDVAGGKI